VDSSIINRLVQFVLNQPKTDVVSYEKNWETRKMMRKREGLPCLLTIIDPVCVNNILSSWRGDWEEREKRCWSVYLQYAFLLL